MNTRILLMVFLVSTPFLPVRAQWEAKPQINVSGSAEVKVEPDEVDLTVGVETRHQTLEGAKQQNDERVAAALNFLKRSGVRDKDLKTDYISIEPVHGDGDIDPATGLPLPKRERRGSPTEPWYYVVRKTIGIKLTDVSKFDTVLGGLVTNGVNHVQGIEFRTSQLRKYKDQARAMAAQAAKEKAEAMASSLGVKVGKPYSINVNDWGGYSSWSRGGWGYSGGGGQSGSQNTAQNIASGSAEAGETFAVGQISITANVTVTFYIE